METTAVVHIFSIALRQETGWQTENPLGKLMLARAHAPAAMLEEKERLCLLLWLPNLATGHLIGRIKPLCKQASLGTGL